MKDKVLVITGGTKGIGLALVQKFLGEGFKVFTCGSSENSIKGLQSKIVSDNLVVSQVDLKDKKAIQKWATEIQATHPAISILVNNAGKYLPGSVGEELDGVFEEIINTNLASAYHVSRAFLPNMKEAMKGHIFNICSTASIMAYTNGGSYCISKFGLLGMSKVLREELKPFFIKVTSILPGATFTDSWAGSGFPEERFIKPEDIANLIWSAYSMSVSSVVEEILIRPLAGDIS